MSTVFLHRCRKDTYSKLLIVASQYLLHNCGFEVLNVAGKSGNTLKNPEPSGQLRRLPPLAQECKLCEDDHETC